MEIAHKIPSECRTGDQSDKGDIWAGTAPSAGLSTGEKTRRTVYHWAPGECPVSCETRETGIGEIVSICGVRGEISERESVN